MRHSVWFCQFARDSVQSDKYGTYDERRTSQLGMSDIPERDKKVMLPDRIDSKGESPRGLKLA